ncbi:hypothetical protein LEP1GSC127_4141 [Leptospira kirschneri str. 200801925]|nr:hypothetical protein LEP1GSC127_4141 [Leptospira kirschneri str. 200801925]
MLNSISSAQNFSFYFRFLLNPSKPLTIFLFTPVLTQTSMPQTVLEFQKLKVS